LKGTLGEGVLKMSSGSLIVLKGIRGNNMYYLKSSAVTRLASLERLDGNSTILWRKRLRQVSLKTDQALEGASTCHLKSHESCVLYEKNVRFGIVTQHLHSLLDYVHVDILGPTKTTSI